jgi:DNA-binding protein YbaB
MTEPDLSPEQRRAKVAELRQQATGAIAGLRAQMAAVKQAQQQALTSTGEATSKDGSVKVVVDATGVVTALTFSPSAFERTTPEKLSQTVVATIQAAAAQARTRVSESLAPVRAESDKVMAAAGAGTGMDASKLSVPSVPRTAVDPSEQNDPWRQATPPPPVQPVQYTSPPPAPSSRPTRPARLDDDGDDGGSVFNEGSW